MKFSPEARARVGVLISGRGSNMAALIDAAAADGFPAEIALVLSNRADAAGLETAKLAGIATGIVDHRAFATRADFEVELTTRLDAAGIDIVCNAGFMRLLTATFTERWHNRHLNIHPSLLPAYKGLNTHARVLADGVRITGATVHVVREAMDAGPIVAQAAVPVLAGDDADTLADRVLAAEHRLYPHALAMFASGRARIVDERVVSAPVTAAAPDRAMIVSPPDD